MWITYLDLFIEVIYNISMGLDKNKEKSAVINLFLDFIGGMEAREYPYAFWLKKVGKCTYADGLEIIKSLESLPIEYNKAGTIINKLKKFNGK